MWQVLSGIISLNSYRTCKRPLTCYHPHFTDVETEGERSALSTVIQLLQGAASSGKLEDSAAEIQAYLFPFDAATCWVFASETAKCF